MKNLLKRTVAILLFGSEGGIGNCNAASRFWAPLAGSMYLQLYHQKPVIVLLDVPKYPKL
jgi:hypothetical protein